jgi:hypothetical protein
LRGQAKIFCQKFDLPPSFAFSDGWLDNFKKRQGIKPVLKHGEANDTDEAGVQLAREAIPKIIAGNRYAAEEIHNQDETGQFWQQMPQRSLATGRQARRRISSALRRLCAAMPPAQTSASCLSLSSMVVHQQVGKIALWADLARLIMLWKFKRARENEVAQHRACCAAVVFSNMFWPHRSMADRLHDATLTETC